MSYGAKSNAELLLFYGFTVDGNPYDTCRCRRTPGGEVAEVTARERRRSPGSIALSPHAARGDAVHVPVGRPRDGGRRGVVHVLVHPRTAPVSSEGEAAAACGVCGAPGALLEQLEGGDEAARVWESNAEARSREAAGASAGSESGSGSASPGG